MREMQEHFYEFMRTGPKSDLNRSSSLRSKERRSMGKLGGLQLSSLEADGLRDTIFCMS